MTTRIVMGWNLRQVMATRGMYQTSELVPLLAERGVHLSREHVYRLVTKTPQRLNIDVLAALCDILDCEPNDLLQPPVQEQSRAKTGTGDAARASVTCARSGPRSAGPTAREPSRGEPGRLRALRAAKRCFTGHPRAARLPALHAAVRPGRQALPRLRQHQGAGLLRRAAPAGLRRLHRQRARLRLPGRAAGRTPSGAPGARPACWPNEQQRCCPSPAAGSTPGCNRSTTRYLPGPDHRPPCTGSTAPPAPTCCARMARGEVEISHATFEAMPDEQDQHLPARPARRPRGAATVPRRARTGHPLAGRPPHRPAAEQADVLARFARWQVLRRLRHQEQHGTLTHGAISAARGTIVATARLHGLADQARHDHRRHHPGRPGPLRPRSTAAERTR